MAAPTSASATAAKRRPGVRRARQAAARRRSSAPSRPAAEHVGGGRFGPAHDDAGRAGGRGGPRVGRAGRVAAARRCIAVRHDDRRPTDSRTDAADRRHRGASLPTATADAGHERRRPTTTPEEPPATAGALRAGRRKHRPQPAPRATQPDRPGPRPRGRPPPRADPPRDAPARDADAIRRCASPSRRSTPPARGGPARRGVAAAGCPASRTLVHGRRRCLRAVAAASGVAPQDVERQVASALAFLRRRVDRRLRGRRLRLRRGLHRRTSSARCCGRSTVLVPGRGARHREHPRQGWRASSSPTTPARSPSTR